MKKNHVTYNTFIKIKIIHRHEKALVEPPLYKHQTEISIHNCTDFNLRYQWDVTLTN